MNLAASVLHRFGVRPEWPILAPEALPGGLLDGARAVVLLVVDAFGRIQMDRALAGGCMPNLAALLHRSGTADSTLTSVFPSTTVAAFTSLNTGRTPAEHGLLGYVLWFREAGSLADCLTWKSRPGGVDVFERVAPDAGPTLYERLSEVGVQGFVVSDALYRHSPLTRLAHRGARYLGYVTPSSLAPLTAEALAAAGGGPAFVFSYWHGLDDVAHAAGPESAEHEDELRMFDGVLGRLVQRLRGTDTLLLVTGDHGQIQLDPERTCLVNGRPEIESELAFAAAGDRRCAYLRARDGRVEALRAAVERAFGEKVDLLRASDALASGLFGATSSPYMHRIGDWIVLPRGSGRFAYDPAVPDGGFQYQKGSHGGMTPAEMLVPLVAAVL